MYRSEMCENLSPRSWSRLSLPELAAKSGAGRLPQALPMTHLRSDVCLSDLMEVL